MAKIYFSQSIEKILDRINYAQLGNIVAIKVHFGEMGCNTYINPKLVKKVFDKITGLGKNAKLVECNILYKGSRTNRTDHLKTARSHGFQEPIDILDGAMGKDLVEVKGCKLGKGIKKYDSLVILSHFKGHGAAGFGGALKNVGMGLGSRAGKLHMHSKIKPSIVTWKCTGCGVCLENCPAGAIALVGGKANINSKLCGGCAMCISVCSSKAASVPWHGGTSQELQEKIARYAVAVSSLFPQVHYINVLENITRECDCMGIKQRPMMKDVGILYSTDIVAIDKASLDLADKFSQGRFNRINPVNKDQQIKFAEKLGLGSSQYKIYKA